MDRTLRSHRLANLLGALLIALTSLVATAIPASAGTEFCPTEVGTGPCVGPSDFPSDFPSDPCLLPSGLDIEVTLGDCGPCFQADAAAAFDPCLCQQVRVQGGAFDPCLCLDIASAEVALEANPCLPDPCLEIGTAVAEFRARPEGDVRGRTGGISIPSFGALGERVVQVDPCEESPVVAPPAPSPIPGVTVTSTSSPTSGVGPGDTVTFTHVVTNTGETTLRSLTVGNEVGTGGTDADNGGSSAFAANTAAKTAAKTAAPAPITAAAFAAKTVIEVVTQAAGVTLAPGDSTTVTSTYVVRESDLPGPLTSTVRVATSATSATATSLVGLVASPALILTSTPDVTSTQWNTANPPSITWTYVLTNIGDVTLSGLALADGVNGAVGLGGVGDLAPGQSTTTTATYTVSSSDALAAEVVNSARATGLTNAGGFVEALAQSTVALTFAPSAPAEPAPAPAPAPEPEAEVLGEVVEREPAPAPAPAPIAAPETLPATGEHDAAMGALAFLLMLSGLVLVVGVGGGQTAPAGRRND